MRDLHAPDLTNPAHAAAYVADAFAAQDPFLIVLALKEIGTARRVPVVLGDKPMLSDLLRAMRNQRGGDGTSG